MRARSLLVLAIAILLASAARAQQPYPAAEGFIGFAVTNNAYGTDRHNSPGAQMNFSYNPHRFIRALVDVGFQYHGSDLRWSTKKINLQEYQIMFGPEVAIRNRTRVTPFVRALIGYASRNYAIPSGHWYCNPYPDFHCDEGTIALARDRGFASAFGGGVDWQVHPNLSVRFVQFELLRTHLSRDNPNFVPDTGAMPVVTGWQNNYRFATGVVFRLGERGTTR